MPDLDFTIERVEVVDHAAVPTLVFKLKVRSTGAIEPIHTVVLRCQVRIEPGRRRYAPADQERLHDLFGAPDRWGQTMRSMLWTHVSAVVPAFAETTVVDLHVPCSYDFNVAATKYFYALEEGDVALTFLFSGTIFYEAADGALQIAQVPWEKEASFRLPMQVWQAMMAHYYPNTAWLCLRRDVFDRLYRCKVSQGIPTWEQLVESLLDTAEARRS